ncbi:MAG TPA: sigma 54-interacting transcriptional regulator [Terriglobia bacterium]|nr:sigma 54-interacting transcriptional regulator [Terriglobia bacterium]
MSAEPRHESDVITQGPRDALVLRVWEAVTTERELRGVLAAVVDLLAPLVPVDSMAVVVMQGDKHDLYDIHIPGVASETLDDILVRQQYQPPSYVPDRPIVPYPPAPDYGALEPYTCADLLQKETWWEHEPHLVSGGVRAYASIPLVVRGKLTGVAVFSRYKPEAFPPDQIAILTDVSRAVAVAVANALANEEIRKLRDQLEAENIALRSQLGQAPWFEDIVGSSPALRCVLEAVEQVAPTDATVLITGETGAGKELIARAIHRRSARAQGPLIRVNCAATPDTLMASELFGHERGAFTGAVGRRKGRFEQAHHGTLFLDEVSELSPEAQVMLLRVLQEREFERVGGSETLQVDVRIVTATNRDLAEDVRAGGFRNDLYYRLNVFSIPMPPLRERPEDIPLLAAHFAAKHGARLGRSIARIDRQSMKLLEAYAWPGNVRELENIIERAVVLARNGTLRVDRETLPGSSPPGDIQARLRDEEREAIETALRASRGRVSGSDGAAKRLGLAPSTLDFRIKRLGINKFQYRLGT